MKKISKADLPRLFDALSERAELFLPVRSADQTDFRLYTQGCEVDLDTLKTVKSPKDLFFPQSESLYTVSTTDNGMEIAAQRHRDSDFIIFGMRACDARGIEILDKVFLSDPVDTYYAARRKHGTIIACACAFPEETCFCNIFDIDCTDPAADIAVSAVDDNVYFDARTDKGEELLSSLSALFTEADDKDVQQSRQRTKEIIKKLPYSDLSLEKFGVGKTAQLFDSPLWEKLYKPCLACGTCTFVCPTCQCYDIKDYDTGHGVIRYRCWDSCMYSDFTMMAHGNNRTSQMQRFRQRFMHKLVYFPDNNDGTFSCVGCGRCLERCPASLNIAKVITAFSKGGN